MRRTFAMLVTVTALGGCALPMPVTVASWALDGLSLMSTDKTLADHGLSALAGQDCAIWRGLTEDQVCRDDRGNMLAVAAPRPTLKRTPVELAGLAVRIEDPYLKVE